MQVTFQGISNISIIRNHHKVDALYRAVNGKIKHGQMNFSECRLNCKLSNDIEGDDLQYFQDQLAKCSMHYQIHCVDLKNPDVVDISMIKKSAQDSMKDNFNLSIKDCDIVLDEFQVKPMLEFVTNLIEKIAQKTNISNKDRKTIQYIKNIINKSKKSNNYLN